MKQPGREQVSEWKRIDKGALWEMITFIEALPLISFDVFSTAQSCQIVNSLFVVINFAILYQQM